MPVAAPSCVADIPSRSEPTFGVYRPAPLASPSRNGQKLEQLIVAAGSVSQYYKLLDSFDQLEAMLTRESRRTPDWNSYGAEPPSADAVAQTRLILRMLLDELAVPRQLAASAEGGIALCFIEDDRYSDIEVFNTGEISAAMYRRGTDEDALVIDIEPTPDALHDIIGRIRRFQLGR